MFQTRDKAREGLLFFNVVIERIMTIIVNGMNVILLLIFLVSQFFNFINLVKLLERFNIKKLPSIKETLNKYFLAHLSLFKKVHVHIQLLLIVTTRDGLVSSN